MKEMGFRYKAALWLGIAPDHRPATVIPRSRRIQQLLPFFTSAIGFLVLHYFRWLGFAIYAVAVVGLVFVARFIGRATKRRP